MAEHARMLVRRALVALLKQENADVGDNVFTGRAHPLTKDELPAIDVDFGRVGSRPDGGPIATSSRSGPTRILRRTALLTLGVTVRHADDYLDVVDAVWADIEPALAENNRLIDDDHPNGLVVHITPVGEPRVAITAEGDVPVAASEMLFEVEYVTAFNAPESIA